MTPGNQRLALARLDGLTVCHCCLNAVDPECCYCGESKAAHGYNANHGFIPMGCVCGYSDDRYREQNQWNEVPDYLGDLNAIHLLEKKTLTTIKMREIYAHWLEAITQNYGYPACLIMATATHKGEAMLRTMDAWTEETPAT